MDESALASKDHCFAILPSGYSLSCPYYTKWGMRRDCLPKHLREFHKRLIISVIIDFLEIKQRVSLQALCRVFYCEHLPKMLQPVQYFSEPLRKLHDIEDFPEYYGHHDDYDLHTWHRINLPAGWNRFYCDAMLRVNWKDHGYGNNKGHLWARIAPNEWRRISKHVADHDWRTDVLHLPKEFFQLDSEQARVLELATESHYSDEYVWSDTSGYEIHIAPGSRLIMRRSKDE